MTKLFPSFIQNSIENAQQFVKFIVEYFYCSLKTSRIRDFRLAKI